MPHRQRALALIPASTVASTCRPTRLLPTQPQTVTPPKIRAGLIVDYCDQPFSTWQLFQLSHTSQLYSIEAIIIAHPSKPASTDANTDASATTRRPRHDYYNKAKVALEKRCLELLRRSEWSSVKKNQRYRHSFDKAPLDSFNAKKVYIDAIFSSDRASCWTCTSEQLESLRDLDLDLLIMAASGVPTGEILDICPLGTLVIQLGNSNEYRGSLPGFWEVFRQAPTTGFSIKRLQTTPKANEIILEGAIPTASLYIANLCNIHSSSTIALHHLIERTASNGTLPEPKSSTPYAYPLRSSPTINQQLKYLSRTLKYRIREKIQNICRPQSDRWSIAYQFIDDWKKAELAQSITIKNPPYRFFADPFIKCKDGRFFVYAEDYDYRSSTGKISAFEISKSGSNYLGTALEENFHLSYPFCLKTMAAYTCALKHIRQTTFACIDALSFR